MSRKAANNCDNLRNSLPTIPLQSGQRTPWNETGHVSTGNTGKRGTQNSNCWLVGRCELYPDVWTRGATQAKHTKVVTAIPSWTKLLTAVLNGTAKICSFFWQKWPLLRWRPTMVGSGHRWPVQRNEDIQHHRHHPQRCLPLRQTIPELSLIAELYFRQIMETRPSRTSH